MKIAEDKLKQIIELHSTGLVDREIGEKVGLCSDAIYYHRKRLGLPANGPTKGSLIIDEQGRRKCSKCGEFYDVKLFASDGEGGIRRCCIFCRKEYTKQNYEDTKSSLERAIIYRCKYWKKRAKDENIPYNINYDYVMDILQKQDCKCFYSDREMLLDGSREDHNYSLSIDKVIPELGYVKGNVVFCIHKINMVKNNMTLEEIKEWTPKFYQKIIDSKFLDLSVIMKVKQEANF
jgi:hypothetical protein